MKNQNTMLIVAICIASMLVIPGVIAGTAGTPVLYAPLNYTNHTASVTYNCTTLGAGQILNVTIYTNSTAGAMTSLGSEANTSVNQTVWEGSVTITSTNDGINQNISCYADNGTSLVYSEEIAATNIMLDSTDPVCNMSILHPSIAYAGLQTINWFASDAIEWVSSSMVIDGPGSQTTITETCQNGPFELTSTDTKYNGDWTATLTVTDRAGNTCTASETFKSQLLGYDEEYGEVLTVPSKGNGKTLLILAALGVGAYFVFKKK